MKYVYIDTQALQYSKTNTSEMQGIVGASKYKHMHMPRATSTHT